MVPGTRPHCCERVETEWRTRHSFPPRPAITRVSLGLIFGLERDVPDRLADTEQGVTAARCEDGRMSGAPLPRGTVTFLVATHEPQRLAPLETGRLALA